MVFLATHMELGRKVAIKIFHPHLVEKKELVYRFLNEARETSKLHHRNIVDVIDIGTDENHIPYFVMEYLTGESLRDKLKGRDSFLSIKETADIMIQILTGLYVAHSNGIIHRDIKPANVFIVKEEDGTELVKILDFGIAKFLELETAEDRELTTDGTIMGTPSFMSPEQAMGKKNEIDHRTDIYACGMIMYRCLTGLNPFKSDNQYDVFKNIIQMKPPAPSFINEKIHREVDEVILKAIEKDKGKRFQDCKSFIQAMKCFYTTEGVSPSGNIAQIVSGQLEVLEVASTVIEGRTSLEISQVDDRGKTRSRFLLPVVLLVVFLAVGMILFWQFAVSSKNGVETAESLDEKVLVKNLQLDAGNTAFGKDSDQGPSLVSIELSGLEEGAEVLLNGKWQKENPIKLERSQNPSVISVWLGGSEIFRKEIIPLKDEKIYIVITAKERNDRLEEKAGYVGKAEETVKHQTKGKGKGDATSKKKKKEKKKTKRKIYKKYPETTLLRKSTTTATV